MHSSSWISPSSFTRNNSLYLCHPPILLLAFLFFFNFFLSLYPSYLSFRILIIPVTFFSPLPSASTERTRPKEEIIAFWHRGTASITSPVLEDHVCYILLHETILLHEMYVFKGTILHANNNDTVLSRRENITSLVGMKSKLCDTSAKNIANCETRLFEIRFRCIGMYFNYGKIYFSLILSEFLMGLIVSRKIGSFSREKFDYWIRIQRMNHLTR